MKCERAEESWVGRIAKEDGRHRQDGAQEGEAFFGEQGRTVAAGCLDVPAFPLLENWRQED